MWYIFSLARGEKIWSWKKDWEGRIVELDTFAPTPQSEIYSLISLSSWNIVMSQNIWKSILKSQCEHLTSNSDIKDQFGSLMWFQFTSSHDMIKWLGLQEQPKMEPFRNALGIWWELLLTVHPDPGIYNLLCGPKLQVLSLFPTHHLPNGCHVITGSMVGLMWQYT